VTKRRSLLHLQAALLPLWLGTIQATSLTTAAGPENEGGRLRDFGLLRQRLVTEGDAEINSQGQAAVEFVVPGPEDKEEWDYSDRLEAQVMTHRRRESRRGFFIGTRGKTGPPTLIPTLSLITRATGEDSREDCRLRGKAVSEKVTLKFHRTEI